MLAWLGRNLRTLALAFILALAVWVSAVTAADPDIVETYSRPLVVEIVGQDPGLILLGSQTYQVSVTLRAPRSVWQQLEARQNALRAVADLSGLPAGEHRVEVQLQVDLQPVRIITISPAELDIHLEPLMTRTLAVEGVITGQPATGFESGGLVLAPAEIVLSGPQSLVEKAERALVTFDIAGLRQDFSSALPVRVLDAQSGVIANLTISPLNVQATLPITQRGGFRDLAVKVTVQGQVASGYRLTNISVFPPVVTVYSADPGLVIDLPGYVETTALNLNGARQDLEVRLPLLLPEGVSLVGNQTVLVQAGVSAIESSLTLAGKPVEVIGLGSGLEAHISPATVDILLSGPLPLLDTLRPEDVRVVVDLTGLTSGTHQIVAFVDILIPNISVESINPGTIEVTLTISPTGTPVP